MRAGFGVSRSSYCSTCSEPATAVNSSQRRSRNRGLRGRPNRSLPRGKGLVEQTAAGSDGGHDAREQRPVQVVGHDDCIERALRERPGTAILQILHDEFEPAVADDGRGAGIPVDPCNATAPIQEVPYVAAAAAGDVEDGTAVTEALSVPNDPR